MKKTDIALLILIAGLGFLVSWFAVSNIFGDPQDETITIKVTHPITADIVDPDPAIFNENALNPTVEIEIGDDEFWCAVGDIECIMRNSQ